MRLTDLDPQLLARVQAAAVPATRTTAMIPASEAICWRDTPADAQGLRMLCPKCAPAPGGCWIGSHTIVVWSAMTGTGYGDLTLPGEITSSCGWRGRITNGEVECN